MVIATEELLLELSIRGSNVAFLAGPLVDLGGAGPSRLDLRGWCVESVIVELFILHPAVSECGSKILRIGDDAGGSGAVGEALDGSFLETSFGHFVRMQRSDVVKAISKSAW